LEISHGRSSSIQYDVVGVVLEEGRGGVGWEEGGRGGKREIEDKDEGEEDRAGRRGRERHTVCLVY
jgi:hypothetical protein